MAISNDQDAWESVAQEIGFRLMPRLPLDLRMTVETAYGPSRHLGSIRAEERGDYEVGQVMRRRVRGGIFTLCNFSREEVHRPISHSHWTAIRRQTLLIFTAGKIWFPTAELWPNRVGQPCGNEGLQFKEDPEFLKRIHVSTALPRAVRPLLSNSVRDVLKANADLGVSMHARNILIYVAGLGSRWEDRTQSNLDALISRGSRRRVSKGQSIAPADWPSFFEAAAEIVNAIRKAEIETRTDRPSLVEIDVREGGANGGPGYGILPREEVDQFLEHRQPRRVSQPILRATRSHLTSIPRLFGWILLIIPSLLLGVVWLPSFPETRAFPSVLLSTLSLAGVGCLVLPAWKRWRIHSLLKHGGCVEARVVGVEPVGMRLSVWNIRYPCYWVSFQYTIAGESYQTEVPAYCDQAKRAGVLIECGDPTRLLVSLRNPWRVFWIGGLVLV